MIMNCIAIGAGGALGAIGRYLLSLTPIQRKGGFPFSTFALESSKMFSEGKVWMVFLYWNERCIICFRSYAWLDACDSSIVI